MKNQELFDRTVGILVKAYQNETLLHTNCCACAVGNIVAANMGYKYVPCTKSGMIMLLGDYGLVWDIMNGEYLPENTWFDATNFRRKNVLHPNGIAQIESTGYTIPEICLIEQSFESACLDDEQPDLDGYLGLMDVVDVLMKIHEATVEEAQSAKELFVLTEAG